MPIRYNWAMLELLLTHLADAQLSELQTDPVRSQFYERVNDVLDAIEDPDGQLPPSVLELGEGEPGDEVDVFWVDFGEGGGRVVGL